MILAVSLLALFSVSAGVFAQAPFPAELERLIWKSLGAWDPLVHNTPSSAAVQQFFTDDAGVVRPVKDLFGNDVFASPFPNDFAAEFAALQVGECTYSALGDWDVYGLDWADKDTGYGPFTRQCKAADGSPVPAPTGSLLNPVGVAIDGERVYVADIFNHRVQVFDFFGTPIELLMPIGNGIPGIGGPSGPGEPAGEKLSSPEGILVDAAHRIAVADGWNQRIAVFNPDGSLAFDHVLAPGTDGAMKPSTIALTPGATLLPPGSTPAAVAADHRLVVTDWTHCQVQIVDTAFNVIKLLPEAVNAPPEGQASHDACWDPEQHVTQPGQFSTVTGVAIDASSRIYISDHAQNVVQVFDKNGIFLASIGRPGEQPAPGELLGPVGLMIDHLGRLGIIDGEHARVAFYTLDFSATPVATFEFQLDVTVAVQDFPMGLAEQWCNPAVPGACPTDDPDTALNEAALNDSKGRYIATDPLKRQLLRFELPDLAIINGTAAAGIGSFDVVVPKQKAAPVIGVHVAVQPVEALTTVDALPTPSTPQDIGAGERVSYSFPYTQTGPTATFHINASGDFNPASGTDLAVADEATVTARAACNGCAAVHAVFNDPPPAAGDPEPATLLSAPNGAWYGREVFVRITPVAPGVPEPGNTVAAIAWQISGAAAATYGSGINETAVAGGALDVIVRVNGRSSLTYWAISQDGSVGPQVTVPLWLDLVEPEVNFLSSLWTPSTGTDLAGRLWNNSAVTGGYVVVDTDSGSPADTVAGAVVPDGSVAFNTEGRDQFVQFTVVDYVGRSTTVSTATATGGRRVSIDLGAPLITPPADLTVVQDGSSFAAVPASFIASAIDPPLGNGQIGSGVASVVGSCAGLLPVGVHSCNFTATDHAGNSATASATFTVLGKFPSTIQYDGETEVYYGNSLQLRALVTPLTATGHVTFTLSSVSLDAPVSHGQATTAMATVLAAAGIHTLTVTYSGDAAAESVSTTAQILVKPRPVTVRAVAQFKVFSHPDPPLTYQLTGGSLVAGDAFTGALTRDPGESVGTYPIRRGNLALSANYALTFVDALLSIDHLSIAVTADDVVKVYGDADPALTFSWSPALPSGVSFSGALVRDPGEWSGRYRIEQGTLSLPGDFKILYHSALLTIAPRDAAVTAGNAAKVFGQADPPIPVTLSGFLPGDTIVATATRAAGENAGTYSTLPHVSGDALANYTVGLVSGSFVINPATVLVRAEPAQMTYGDPVPMLAFSYAEFPAGYSAANVVVPPACSVAGPLHAGSHTITCSGGSVDHNVVFAYEPAQLSVNRRSASIVVSASSRPYGTANPVFGATVEGVMPGDALHFTFDTPAVASSPIGTYPIYAVPGTNPNYAVTPIAGTLSISPLPVTVTAGNAQKFPTQPDPPLAGLVTHTGFLPGDGVVLTATREPGESPGTYAIIPRALAPPAVLANYAIAYVNGVFTILPNAPPTCTTAFGGEIWPPNHKRFYAAPINGVGDPEGLPVTITVTGIRQDEMVDSTGDGRFAPDGGGVGTSTAWLRAERNGDGNRMPGNGRVYEILFTARDAGGAECSGAVFYSVPHDRGQGATAIDDGVRYDSTAVVGGARDKQQTHRKSAR